MTASAPKIVLVEWVDSTMCSGSVWWNPSDEMVKAPIPVANSVGFLWESNDEMVVLLGSLVSSRSGEAPNWDNITEVGEVFKIPKGCIRSIQELKP